MRDVNRLVEILNRTSELRARYLGSSIGKILINKAEEYKERILFELIGTDYYLYSSICVNSDGAYIKYQCIKFPNENKRLQFREMIKAHINSIYGKCVKYVDTDSVHKGV